jgi:hypothetical protein
MGTTVFMSVVVGSWPLRRMASKNIFSLGYTQFPVAASAPDSFSWLAGQEANGADAGVDVVPDEPLVGVDDRGMLETSRCVSRGFFLGAFWDTCSVVDCCDGDGVDDEPRGRYERMDDAHDPAAAGWGTGDATEAAACDDGDAGELGVAEVTDGGCGCCWT